MAKKKSTPKKEKKPSVEVSNIDVSQKVLEGWIHINSIIELMAVKKDVVEEILRNHISKIEAEKSVLIVKKSFSTVEKVENPPKNVNEAYSQYVELEILVRNYPMLVYYVFSYGPSSIEIMQPKSLTLSQGEAQDIANALASLIHQFASTAGGVVVARKGLE